MTDYFYYWSNSTVAENLGARMNHAAGQRLGKVKGGDNLWLITYQGDRLFLVGRLRVGQVVSRREAERLLGTRDLWDARYHVIAPPNKAEEIRMVDITDLVRSLRFEHSSSPTLPAKITMQSFRAMRELAPKSAAAIAKRWRDSAEEQDRGPAPSSDGDWYSADEYLGAFRTIEAEITEPQRKMLAAHAEAADLILNVDELAKAAGYDQPSIVFSQYGRLGHRLADALGHAHQEPVWTRLIADDFRDEEGRVNWEMLPQVALALTRLGWTSAARASTEVPGRMEDGTIDSICDTERETLQWARIGQDLFRRALEAQWQSCAVTGVSIREVLRASHIKPWRDSSPQERLDPFNGLLLVAHLDALFDCGLITFDDRGSLLISGKLPAQVRVALGLKSSFRLRRVDDRHRRYLAYHRREVFRPDANAAG